MLYCFKKIVSGDGVGSVLGYDSLCRSAQYQSRHDSENSILDTDIPQHSDETNENCRNAICGSADGDTPGICSNTESLYPNKHLAAPTPRRRSSSTRFV